jgi:hypothetical protein
LLGAHQVIRSQSCILATGTPAGRRSTSALDTIVVALR